MIEQTPCHLLRKNHRKSLPRKILYIDTETRHQDTDTEQHHRMAIGWSCYYERRPHDEKDTEQWRFWEYTYPFCKYIESLCYDKTTLYLFGHNIFFDLQVADFFFYFTKWGWELDFIYDSGTTYILTIHKGKKRIKALSTTNFYNTSVDHLGKMLSMPKLTIDFEKSTEAELSVYCKRDVEIIKAAMERYIAFITDHDLGKFCLTRGSQAFTAYRHRFMNQRIYIHNSEKAVALEKDAYIGGRVECFHIGKAPGGPFCSLDINSMYPYIMSHYKVPVRLVDYREDVPLKIVRESLRDRCGIAECDLMTDTPLYPIRSNNKIVFPVGSFRAVLCTPELTEAIKRKHVVKIHRYASYESAVIFKEYVDYFYTLRQHYKHVGDPTHTELCKNFLNYLYGKFGQYRPITEKKKDLTYDGYYRLETLDLVTGQREIEYKLFNTKIITHGKVPASTSLIAVAAHITSYARHYLFGIMERIGLDRVLYCDTDSIKIHARNVPIVHDLVDPDKLGYLKIEDEFDSLIMYGPKSYRTEKVRRIKGVPVRAKEIEPGLFSYLQFIKQPTHMRKQVMRYAIVKPTLKRIISHYDKGDVLPSGSVRPFDLRLL